MNARDSLTGRLLIDGVARLRAALATATVTGWAIGATTGTLQGLRAALSNATVVMWLRGAGGAVQNGVADSALSRLFDWLERVARASWLHRRLTAEPEPDVVVVDLRETLIVGPPLALLDRLLDPAVRNWHHADSRTTLERLEAVVRARPIVVLSLVIVAAVLANLVLSLALGTLSSASFGLSLLVAALALAGTRLDASTAELAETRTYAVLSALVEPPEVPDESDREQP